MRNEKHATTPLAAVENDGFEAQLLRRRRELDLSIVESRRLRARSADLRLQALETAARLRLPARDAISPTTATAAGDATREW
jgi:hypothetical protein